MKDSAARQTENQWQELFSGAEAELPDTAWLAIENGLVRIENEQGRRRIVYYQRVAAALLVLCVACVWITITKWDGSAEVVSNAPEKVKELPLKNKSESTLATRQKEGEKESLRAREQSVKGIPQKIRSKEKAEAQQLMQDTLLPVDSAGYTSLVNKESLVLAATLDTSSFKPLTEEEEKEIVRKLLGEEETVLPGKKKTSRSMWASLGVAGGSYSPGQSPSTSAFSPADYYALSGSNNYSYLRSQNGARSGSSYSVGLMVGKQFGKHWIIQAGAAYMRQQIDYQSDIVSNSTMGSFVFEADNSASFSTTNLALVAPYTIQSSAEFLSIPVQAGYVFIDRKFGVALNSGVSTDIFLQNKLTDKSGMYGNQSISGSESVYRPVSWAGLMNTELSLKIAERYRLSLVPGVRYSFTNMLKDDAGSRKPLVFDVGFRLRYVFQ